MRYALHVCPVCGDDPIGYAGDRDQPAYAGCGCIKHEHDPRERDDDDGVEYADPRDEMAARLLEDLT